MTDYFHILGLAPGASELEVRRAYRQLAKQYHPDVNSDDGAVRRFMEINMAYEFLSDPAQRHNYELIRERELDRAEQERRERIYQLWVEHQQRQMRYREAVYNAYQSQGRRVPYSKLFGTANAFTNVVFLCIFIAMTVIPIWRYIVQLSLPEHEQRNILYFLMPTVLGLLFIGFGYYYWFIMKTDRNS